MSSLRGHQINVRGEGASEWSPYFGNAHPSFSSTWMPFCNPISSPFPGYPTYPTAQLTPLSTGHTLSSVVSPYAFTLKVLTGGIKIFQEYRNPFHSAGNIQAPNDLVVCRKE